MRSSAFATCIAPAPQEAIPRANLTPRPRDREVPKKSTTPGNARGSDVRRPSHATGIVMMVDFTTTKTPTPFRRAFGKRPASAQKTKRKTRPAIRRSARWRVHATGTVLWHVEPMAARTVPRAAAGLAAVLADEGPSAPSTVRPLARDPRVLVGLPFPKKKKRQIHHHKGLTHRSCPREFSRSA